MDFVMGDVLKELGVENKPKGKLYSIDTICKNIAFYSCLNTASS